MQNPNDQFLPEKCCAKCGFLYGKALNPATPADGTFDPDLVRSRGYPPSPTQQDGYRQGVITSQAYGIQRYWEEFGAEYPTAEPLQVRSLNWWDTSAICCYKKIFDPVAIHYTSETLSKQEMKNLPDRLPLSLNSMLSTIRKDRQDCSGFFEYHTGFTARQHIELQIEQQKVQRQAEYAEKTLEVHQSSVYLAEAMMKSQKSLTFATWVLVAATAVMAIATIAISIIAGLQTYISWINSP